MLIWLMTNWMDHDRNIPSINTVLSFHYVLIHIESVDGVKIPRLKCRKETFCWFNGPRPSKSSPSLTIWRVSIHSAVNSSDTMCFWKLVLAGGHSFIQENFVVECPAIGPISSFSWCVVNIIQMRSPASHHHNYIPKVPNTDWVHLRSHW